MIINRLLQFSHRLNSNILLVSQSAMLDRDFADIGKLSPINYCHRPLRGYRIYTISLKEIIGQTDQYLVRFSSKKYVFEDKMTKF